MDRTLFVLLMSLVVFGCSYHFTSKVVQIEYPICVAIVIVKYYGAIFNN